MTVLPESAHAVVESGRLAHVVTLNADGSPQVSCAWIAMDGDELVMMHTAEHVKVRNLRRDSRSTGPAARVPGVCPAGLL
jgi:predicted pyridoxine 5'-phosphate oxidase superfamily flavin-nucleotide-binding protein